MTIQGNSLVCALTLELASLTGQGDGQLDTLTQRQLHDWNRRQLDRLLHGQLDTFLGLQLGKDIAHAFT